MIGKLKFSETVRYWLALYRPGKHAWQGAGWGIVILLAVFSVFWAVTLMNVPAPNWGELAGMAANLVLAILAGLSGLKRRSHGRFFPICNPRARPARPFPSRFI